jgi:bifunctional DNase/RNase
MIFLAICIGFVIFLSSDYFVRSDVAANLLEVDVQGLVVDPATNSPIVILVGKEFKKALPIFIGNGEAGAIARGMENVETVRPLTHDLIKSIIDGLEARVERVVVTDLKDNVFFAQIILQLGKSETIIDSRPSDAIALAVRMGSPIYVTKKVMESSSSADLTGWVVEESLAKHFGFKVQNVSEGLLEAMGADTREGVLVSFVEDGSSAHKGGLSRGDIIVNIQGAKVTDVGEFDEILVGLSENEGINMIVSSLKGRKEINLIPEKGE